MSSIADEIERVLDKAAAGYRVPEIEDVMRRAAAELRGRPPAAAEDRPRRWQEISHSPIIAPLSFSAGHIGGGMIARIDPSLPVVVGSGLAVVVAVWSLIKTWRHGL